MAADILMEFTGSAGPAGLNALGLMSAGEFRKALAARRWPKPDGRAALQRLRRKALRTIASKARAAAKQLDRPTLLHLDAWLERFVPADRIVSTRRAMLAVLADEPTLLDKGKGWPDLLRISETR